MRQGLARTLGACQACLAHQPLLALRLALTVALLLTLGACGGESVQVPKPALDGAEPQVAGAVERLAGEVKSAPSDGDVWGRYGVVLDAHGFRAEARIAFARAAELDPGEGRWPYYLAALYDASEPETAVSWYQRAIPLLPDYAPARIRLAETLERLDRGRAARVHYARALELEPDNPFAALGLGRSALDTGELESAVVYLERAYELGPRLHAAATALARAYRFAGREQEARRLAEAARALPRVTYRPDELRAEIAEENVANDAHFRRAVIYRDVGQIERALREARAAIGVDPGRTEAHHLAADLLAQLEDWTGAEAAARKALELAPERDGLRPLYARVLLELGRADEAQRQAEQALREDVAAVGMHVLLGRLAAGRGELEQASEQLAQAVAARPKNSEWRLMLARLESDRGDLSSAQEQLELLLAQEPENVAARSELGFVLLERGRAQAAVGAFNEAVTRGATGAALAGLVQAMLATVGAGPALDRLTGILEQRPQDTTAALLRADLLRGAGRRDEARLQLRALVERQPELVDAWILLGNLALEVSDPRSAAEAYRRALELTDEPAVRELARRGLTAAGGSASTR